MLRISPPFLSLYLSFSNHPLSHFSSSIRYLSVPCHFFVFLSIFSSFCRCRIGDSGRFFASVPPTFLSIDSERIFFQNHRTVAIPHHLSINTSDFHFLFHFNHQFSIRGDNAKSILGFFSLIFCTSYSALVFVFVNKKYFHRTFHLRDIPHKNAESLGTVWRFRKLNNIHVGGYLQGS